MQTTFAAESNRVGERHAATVAGFLGLVPFFGSFVIFPFAYAGVPAVWGPSLGSKVIAVSLVAALPALLAAIVAGKARRQNPALAGKGSLVFAWTSLALFGALLLVMGVRTLLHR